MTSDFENNKQWIRALFLPGKNYDFIERDFEISSKRAYLLLLNGLSDPDCLINLFKNLQDPGFMEDFPYPVSDNTQEFERFLQAKFSFVEITTEDDKKAIEKFVLSGGAIFLLEGFQKGILIDTRKYPIRHPQEPDLEKVLRGSKDGFVESSLTNTVLIRRRIRTAKLSFEAFEIGTDSKTDVILSFVSGKASEKLVSEIRKKLYSIQATDLTMGSRTLQELLVKKMWFHPMPNMMFTERPDVAASYLEEGYVILIVDNSPSVMVLPCSIFQFTQSPEDYYKPVLIGNYIRLIRFVCMALSLLIMPLFILFTVHIPLPGDFSLTKDVAVSPLKMIILALFVEFGLDLFRYSTSHTSDRFAGALSIVGGLILGEMAIELNWASKEILFYGAATLLVSLALSSLELSEAIKMYRLLLIIVTGFFGLPGLICGLGLVMLSIVTTPVIGKGSYLWPLIPFYPRALKRLVFRYPTEKSQPVKINHKK